MCLLVGTGAIRPKIRAGSIVYLLAQALPRRPILLSKLVVALAAAMLFAVPPMMAAAATCRASKTSACGSGTWPRRSSCSALVPQSGA